MKTRVIQDETDQPTGHEHRPDPSRSRPVLLAIFATLQMIFIT